MSARSIRIATTVLACLLAATHAAHADRDLMTPTGWWYFTNATEDQINARRAEGYRLVNIDVVNNNPMRFSAVLVHNSGEYYNPADGWWFGQTPASIADRLSSGNVRLLQCQPYLDANGQLRYVIILVNNTGQYFKGWWYHPSADAAAINTIRDTNNMRLVSWDRVPGQNNVWSCVFISNTGSDQRNWWRYPSTPYANISTLTGQHNARITDIAYVGNGNYDIVLEERQGRTWWWYTGVTSAQLDVLQGNRAARIYDLQQTGTGPDGPLFTFLLLRNSNDLTHRVSGIMRGIMDNEIYVRVGALLKRVNGGRRAGLNNSRVFDPASTIKTLHHVHAMRQVALGNVAFTAPIPVRGFDGSPGGCPAESPVQNEPLDDVLRLMMENSDNIRTEAVKDYFGQANINITADALDMADTELVRRIGCGGDHNMLTLDDGARLHEEVANGYLGAWRDEFYDLMLNGAMNYGGGGGYPNVGGIIDEEAANIGLPDDKRLDFRAAVEIAAKGGSVGLDGLRYRSSLAWISIPYMANGVITPQEFTVGSFVDGAVDDDLAAAAVGAAASEVLRDELRAALLTWLVPGTLTLTPQTGFQTTGPEGGPFTPDSIHYTLRNIGDTAVQWTVTENASWARLVTGGGNLAPGGQVFVSVYLDDSIYDLPAGIYNGTLTVTNVTNGNGSTTRALRATIEERLPGDTDGDCDVDLSDLSTLLSHFGMMRGATAADGDTDGDGDVDLTDLAALLASFGTTCP
ncbi:MAG: hypothetical protein AMXMBFR47_38200 [Planctomycetota bacterium]